MSEPIRYETAVAELIKRVPEFTKELDSDNQNLPYWDPESRELVTVVYDSFGDFLRDLFLRGTTSDKTLEASFALIDEMGNSNDGKVVNLVRTCVFEALCGSKKCVSLAQRHLKGRALEEFEKTRKYFTPIDDECL